MLLSPYTVEDDGGRLSFSLFSQSFSFISRQFVRPMPARPAAEELSFLGQPCQNTARGGGGDLAKPLHIPALDGFMGLQVRLDLLPAQGSFALRSIAHCIAHSIAHIDAPHRRAGRALLQRRRSKGNPFPAGRPKGICRRSSVGENREFLERSGENSRHIGGKAPCGKIPPRHTVAGFLRWAVSLDLLWTRAKIFG